MSLAMEFFGRRSAARCTHRTATRFFEGRRHIVMVELKVEVEPLFFGIVLTNRWTNVSAKWQSTSCSGVI